jgi:hypothetical protein
MLRWKTVHYEFVKYKMFIAILFKITCEAKRSEYNYQLHES